MIKKLIQFYGTKEGEKLTLVLSTSVLLLFGVLLGTIEPYSVQWASIVFCVLGFGMLYYGWLGYAIDIVHAQRDYISAMQDQLELSEKSRRSTQDLLDTLEEFVYMGKEIPKEYFTAEKVKQIQARIDKKVKQG